VAAASSFLDASSNGRLRSEPRSGLFQGAAPRRRDLKRRDSSSHHDEQADSDGDGLRLDGDGSCVGWSATATASFGSTVTAQGAGARARSKLSVFFILKIDF
jgi:hypothetical protein